LTAQFELLGEPVSDSLVVSHHNQYGLLLTMQCQEQGCYGISRLTVEVTRRLVTKYERRMSDESPSQCDALLFTTRQLGGPIVKPFAEPHPVEKVSGTCGAIWQRVPNECR